MPEVVSLDLNKITLYGCEPTKSELVIEAIINGIEAGDEFPLVDVIRITDDIYHLADAPPKLRILCTYGCHNRTLGHYIASKPLKCRIIKRIPIPEHLCITIRGILITKDGFNDESCELKKDYIKITDKL